MCQHAHMGRKKFRAGNPFRRCRTHGSLGAPTAPHAAQKLARMDMERAQRAWDLLRIRVEGLERGMK